MASGDPVAGNTYLHTGDVLSRGSGGEYVPRLCTIFSYFRTSLAFPYDWENETILPGALRHFKRYQTCIVTFCTYYIAWILGDEGEGGEWRLQPVPRADRQHGV